MCVPCMVPLDLKPTMRFLRGLCIILISVEKFPFRLMPAAVNEAVVRLIPEKNLRFFSHSYSGPRRYKQFSFVCVFNPIRTFDL